MSHVDSFAVNFVSRLLKMRWLVLITITLLFVVLASGAQYLGFATDYRVFFGKENDQLQEFEKLQRVYSKTDNITFVLKPRQGDIFNAQTFQAIQEITEDSWKLPFSKRVDSLSNYQHTFAQEDDLTVVDLIEGDPTSFSQDDFQRIRNIALNEPLLTSALISPDGTTTGVNVTFHLPQKDPFEVPKVSAVTQEMLTRYQEKYPDIEMVASGIVSLNNAFAQASMDDLANLFPIMYAVLLITLLLFLRSFSATFSTFIIILFSAVTAMGLAGWIGIRLTPPSSSAPTIILTLAIADSIHIIISVLKAMGQGMTKREAILESIRINFQPVLITSVTTAFGFLTLNFSDVPPFGDLGNITAMGVIAAFFYSMIILPILLDILPLKARINTSADHKPMMQRFAEFVTGNYRKLFYISTFTVVVLAALIPRIEVNDEWIKYFDYSIPFRAESEFVMDNLTGMYRLEYSIPSTGPSGVTEPEYLSNLEAFTDWLRAQPEVDNVFSMSDIFKRLNRNLHGDQIEWHRIPDTKEMAAQYLLLYEFSLPYGLDLTDRINVDKSATRLTVTVKGDMPTIQMQEFEQRTEKWLVENTPSYMHTDTTGPSIMFAYIAERNIKSMTTGNIIALLLISLTIVFALKSLRMGMFSLIPNLVPPIMGFGIWSIIHGQVNMAVAIVTAISLGIIVDDTVHFLSKYHRARKEKNLDTVEAIHYAFNTVGPALTVTTFVLILGFAVLAFSAFQINALMGLLTAIIIGCALVADFFLLPTVLMFLDKQKKDKSS